jgi:hypothetical protein
VPALPLVSQKTFSWKSYPHESETQQGHPPKSSWRSEAPCKDTSSDGSSFSVIHVILKNKTPHFSFEKWGFWRSAIATSLKIIGYFLDRSLLLGLTPGFHKAMIPRLLVKKIQMRFLLTYKTIKPIMPIKTLSERRI